ncbi:MAG: DUF2179 domain-containing protein [Candidatus Omnitrophica bacterium]|nr:DUF2179 domain-containing protein [Candidatus Omnitrophota bacterium]
MAFLDSAAFTWGVLPALIFVARICDMSLDTMRIIMIGHGRKGLASFFGFIEVTIWLVVARQVIVHLPNPACFIAYAAGFATGNYVGMAIEERLASGVQMVRMIVDRDGGPLIAALKVNGFGFTTMTGQGAQGPVDVIFTIVDRSRSGDVIRLIETVSPKAFYTIEDVRYASEGVFPPEHRHFLDLFRHR